MGPQNIIEIDGKHKNLRKEIEKIFGARLLTYYNRQTLPDVSSDRTSWGDKEPFVSISFIFLLLAILAMYTTIRRLITSQTGEIATLKALGFSNAKFKSIMQVLDY
ncbi:MAG: FtsX-like permease family protein [Limosilactobacillus pontis]